MRSGRGFEAVPSAGSRGRCEPSLGDKLRQESTDPVSDKASGRQRSEPGGRCQGLGEPVRSVLPGSFHGVILPGIIKITSSLCVGLCYTPSYAVSFIKQQSSAAEEGCCYPLVEPPSRTCVVCTRHCARRPARSHFRRDRVLSQGIHSL